MEQSKTLEILKQAILLETRGKAFYHQASGNSADPEVKKIFSILAEEEESHIRFLIEQYRSYQASGKFELSGLSEDDWHTTADQVLTDTIKGRISAAGFEAAAISAAIDMENRAIAVYSERADSADDPEEKRFYQWLAEWERGHHKLLFHLDQELKEKIWNDNSFWPF